MSNPKHRLILEIVLTDSTFEKVVHRGREVWTGKCIHCGAHLSVRTDGVPVSRATIEHIVPRNHGGGDDLRNLALACARCNSQKGRHFDHRSRTDAKLQEVVARLLERRLARWRDP